MNENGGELRLEGVWAGYGKTIVLESIDFNVAHGESISIIGRNGVGKSSLLETIMGHTTLHRGRITVEGRDITRLRPFRRVWAGLGYVPQEREIFPSLTVTENLAVAQGHTREGFERVFELFPQLKERRWHRGSQLSGGEQQMLAIARALLVEPSVLLMDEPSEGLAPMIVEQLQLTMGRLRRELSLSIILVEQNSRVALDFAERCIVMNRGRIVRDGPSDELKADPQLLDRLIGVDVA